MEKNKEKLSKFSEVLSQLRKERGISQKKAATDLGISQALLSHYEKGIRECGLDFVIRCSKYYGVTTDYLLGISESRTGLDSGSLTFESGGGRSLETLSNATRCLIEAAGSVINGEKEKQMIYDYYMLALYRGALTLEKAGILPKEMFRLDYTVGKELATAAVSVQDAKFVFLEDKSRTSFEVIERTALNDMIDEAEEYIINNYID